MTTKLKFFLLLLAMMVGGLNGAWADIVYEFYSYNNALVNTSNYYSNGDVSAYTGFSANTTIADGSSIVISTAMRINNSNRYASFTTTAPSSTVTIGICSVEAGNNSFKFDNSPNGGGSSNKNDCSLVTINNVGPGNHTITSESGDRVGVYYVKVVENPFNNSYPYTWDFTKWTTVFTTSSYYWSNNTYQQATSLSQEGGTLLYFGPNGIEVPETKGLKFHSGNKRVSVNSNYLGIYVSDIIVPNVTRGYAIEIVTAKTSSAGISVGGTALTPVGVGDNWVYTYNCPNTGDVTLTFAGASNSIMQVYSISVKKGEVPQFIVNGSDVYEYDYSNNYVQIQNADVGTNNLALPYDASHPFIRFKVNMEESQTPDWTSSIANSSYFTITNSSNTGVISITDPAITAGSAQGNRVYIYGAKINGVGTTELTFRFAGNDVYNEKTVTATVTVYDNDHPYIAFSKTTDTYDLVTMNYTEPVLTVLPTSLASSVVYSSDYPSIAIPDNTSNPKGNLMIVNTGVVNITAAVTSGGQKYSASYELTIKAEEAVWDIRNGNELYFPTRNTNPDALKNNLYNNNTGKLLVRKVTSIPHMTMEFGDVSNSNMAMVAIRNDVRAANMIDQNGWQHAWLNNDNSDWLMKPYQGTFYKFVPSISGNLTIKGVRSHNGSGVNIVVLVDKDLVTTGDWDTHVTNGTRTRYSVVTIVGGNTTTVNYYSYPIVKTLNFENDNAYAVTEEPVTLIGGHTYYLYAVTPNTSGTRTINRDVTPNTDTSTGGDWQNFYLSGFVFETPDFKFNKKNVVMGTTGVTAPGYNRIPQSTSYQQTINDETTTNPNITYSRICKGGINCDIDANTGQLTNISGSGAIVVTATLTETGGATSKTSYVLTVPYTTIQDGGSKSWVFNWDNYNYNNGTPTGDNRMEQVSTLSTNAPASEWTIKYKVRRYASDGTNALNYINVPVLANALEVKGDNARYIGTTAGLLFNADASSFGTTTTVKNDEYKMEIIGDGVGRVYQRTGSGDNDFVELTRSDEIDRALTTLLNYNASDAVNPCNYVTMENGTSMTIPNLKAGQHVRIKWSRYSPGQGDRMIVSNLNDLNGNPVSKSITIGAGGNVNRNGGTGYHEFIVAADGDVTFTLDQNGWANIYKIDVANSFIPTDLQLETNKAYMRKADASTTFTNMYTINWGDVLCQSNTLVQYEVKDGTPTGTLSAGNNGNLSIINNPDDEDTANNPRRPRVLNVDAGGHGRFTMLQNGYVKSTDGTESYLLDQREYEIKVYEYDYTTKTYPYTWNLENMSATTATVLSDESNLTNSNNNYKTWATAGQNKYQLTLEPENLIAWKFKTQINGLPTDVRELDGLGIRPDDISKTNSIILGTNNTGIELPSSQDAEIITVPEVASGQYVYLRVKKGNNANIEAKAISKGVTTDRTGYIETVYDNGSYAVYKLQGGGKVSDDGNINTLEFYLKDVTIMQVAVSKDSKSISDAGYATESRDYNLDFSLNGTLGGNALTVNKVTGVNGAQVVLGSTTTPYVPHYVDVTNLVSTSWSKSDNNTAGTPATTVAPAVITSDGRCVQMSEYYEHYTGETTGTLLKQTISNLGNGTYEVELYANALFTPGRGFTSDMADGAQDVAYVFANSEKQYLTCHIGGATSENGIYKLTVEVTNNTLNLGLGRDQAGTNWHTIQIKRLALVQGQGVLLKGNQGSYPLFTWDVNRTTSDMTGNKLVGVWEVTNDTPKLPQKDGSNYNYILAKSGALIRYVFGENGTIDNTIGTQTGSVNGLGFYLVIKEGTILDDGPYLGAKPKVNSAYLQLSGDYLKEHAPIPENNNVSVRQYFLLDVNDDATEVKSVDAAISTASMDDDAYYSLQGVRVDNPGKGLYIRGGKKVVIK